MVRETSHRHKNVIAGLFSRTRRAVPRRDKDSTGAVWSGLLIGFPVFIMLIAGWSTYLFVGISRESIFTGPVQEPERVQTIDREQLRTTLDFFQARTAQFEALKLSPPEAVDPAR